MMSITLWAAQIILAVTFIAGAVMKFMPVEKISAKMPWMGQVPVAMVRLLGVLDMLCAAGLILPSLLHIMPQLVPLVAAGIVVYMLCAIMFHVSRKETPVIGFNIFIVIVAAFIAWGLW